MQKRRTAVIHPGSVELKGKDVIVQGCSPKGQFWRVTFKDVSPYTLSCFARQARWRLNRDVNAAVAVRDRFVEAAKDDREGI